jgi:Fe-S-cluster containining protein
MLSAGDFSTWLGQIGKAQGDNQTMSVPCGECTACCTASQFILIRPDESDAIAHIPAALLFPAPGLPEGNVVMGYDEHGACPMFVDGRCSIYEHRPQTCRAYDCRVLTAAAVELDDDTKAEITARTRRWRFTYASAEDERSKAAVEAAARYLQDHRQELPTGMVPPNPTQIAFLAIEIHQIFLIDAPPSLEDVQNAIVRTRPD